MLPHRVDQSLHRSSKQCISHSDLDYFQIQNYIKLMEGAYHIMMINK